MGTTTSKQTAKDRILKTASDLFYCQGYNATGIQQIINEAGVSKGAFYTHFKSKDELGKLYLQKRHYDEMTQLKQSLATVKKPLERYYFFVTVMRDWMKESGYRGCAFANMSAEVVDGKNPIRKEAKYHYETFRAVIKDMVQEVLQSDKKFKGLDLQFVADQYMMIIIGAITNAEIYQDLWPFEHAALAVKKLINE